MRLLITQSYHKAQLFQLQKLNILCNSFQLLLQRVEIKNCCEEFKKEYFDPFSLKGGTKKNSAPFV